MRDASAFRSSALAATSRSTRPALSHAAQCWSRRACNTDISRSGRLSADDAANADSAEIRSYALRVATSVAPSLAPCTPAALSAAAAAVVATPTSGDACTAFELSALNVAAARRARSFDLGVSLRTSGRSGASI